MMIQNQLLEMLHRSISKNKETIAEYYFYRDENLEVKEKFEKEVSIDIKYLIKCDFDFIKDLVSNFEIPTEEKEGMIKTLEVIIQLLTLNEKNNTTIDLNIEQEEIINNFLDKLRNYIISRKQYFLSNSVDVFKLETNNKKYKKIANCLNNSKNMNYITDIEALEDLFYENRLSEEDKNDLYEFILKYNRKIFDSKTGNCNVKELEFLGKTDISKLKKIFENYEYDFDKLPVEIQENIVNRATVSNIKDVFRSLKENGYLLDVEKDSYLLMSLLIESDRITIDKISGLAFSRGLTPAEVLKIGGILIKQTRSKVRSSRSYERFNVEDVVERGLKIVGSSLDFEKNVKELSKWGISVRYVYDRCKYVLVCSNSVLSHNLNLFQDYGFSLKRKVNKLCSATMSALMEYNTFEIIDRFIEVHPLGLEYLRSNLSVLRQINRLDNLLFYKLYYSNKNHGSQEAFMRVISNNSSLLCFQGEVSGLTPMFIESFANINEDNKFEITGTFIPTYSRDYYSLIRNKIDREIDASIFDNPYIQHINIYSDHKEPLIYNFGGIRISKMKVLRVFDALLSVGVESNDEAFLYALLYNTIISKDEFDKIRKMIKLES